jgi:hypothetical protein
MFKPAILIMLNPNRLKKRLLDKVPSRKSDRSQSSGSSTAESSVRSASSALPDSAVDQSSSTGSLSSANNGPKHEIDHSIILSPQRVIPSTSQPRTNLWNDALRRLSVDDRALIAKYSIGTFSDFDIICNELHKACDEKKHAREETRWEINGNRHSIVLRDKVDKIVGWISKLKSVGDIVVNVDPVHAGLPWAGIRLLLQVSTNSCVPS